MGLQNHLILRRPRRGRLEGRTDGWQHIATALLGGILLGGILLGGPAGAQTSDTVDRSELKVCADPNNLPYSDEKKEGFENKIAELMGGELGLKVDYAWFPQVIGFVRNTLRARLCDLVMGTVAGDEIMQTTNPYYFTTYVMFYRSDKALAIEGAQDARLTGLRLGVVAGTPPADLLVRHELMSHTKPYALTVDTRAESPTHQMVQDVIDGTIDVGFLWGPIAGYYRKHDNLPLTMVPLKEGEIDKRTGQIVGGHRTWMEHPNNPGAVNPGATSSPAAGGGAGVSSSILAGS